MKTLSEIRARLDASNTEHTRKTLLTDVARLIAALEKATIVFHEGAKEHSELQLVRKFPGKGSVEIGIDCAEMLETLEAILKGSEA